MDNIKVTDENIEKVQKSEIVEKVIKKPELPITALVAVMVYYIN